MDEWMEEKRERLVDKKKGRWMEGQREKRYMIGRKWVRWMDRRKEMWMIEGKHQRGKTEK